MKSQRFDDMQFSSARDFLRRIVCKPEKGILTIMKSGTKILIVEDEPLVAMMLEMYLSDLGMDVIDVVSDIDGALAAIANDGPEFVTLDVSLAGGKRCDPIAEALIARRIPFVFSSGNPYAPDPWADHDMLPKPFTVKEVEEILSRY